MIYKRYYDNDVGELLTCRKCKQQCSMFIEYIPIVNNRFEYKCKNCSKIAVFNSRLIDIEALVTLEQIFELDNIDKFSLYPGGLNWLYFNPDASCNTGQIVESSLHSQNIIDAVTEAINQTEQSFNDFFWGWLYQEANTYLYDNDGSDMFLGMYESLKNDPCDIGKKSEEDVIKTLITHAEQDLGISVLTTA
jgi:hypothetical protein